MKKLLLYWMLFTNLAAFAQVVVPDANGIVYVKQGETGDGSSWEEAVGGLARALKQAKLQNDVTPGSIKQVWVSAGIYRPMYRPDNLNLPAVTNSHNTFLLVTDVKVYGGFAGNETSIDQRNPGSGANTSVLSGDLFDNDGYSPDGYATTNLTENAYHVVMSAGPVGTAELNGFTISGGSALWTTGQFIEVNNNQNYTENGGGIYLRFSSPTLKNLLVTGNNAANGGGCLAYESQAQLINVIFHKNKVDKWGGAIASSYGGNNTISITNALFTHNESGTLGGAIYAGDCSPQLTNVTITSNITGLNGGGIAGNPFRVRNSILWNNSPNNSAYSSNTDYYNSLVGGTGGSSAWNSTFGDDMGNNLDTDPLFTNAAVGNYTLQAGSPAINTGSNAFYALGENPDLSGVTTDLAASPRITAAVVDMGAFEYIPPIPPEPMDCIPENFDVADFNLAGNAAVITGTEVQLTSLELFDMGALWFNQELDMTYDFSINVELNFGSNDLNGADGIAFVLQPLSTDEGEAGGGIGYQYIVPSLAIEFDTFWNQTTDPSSSDHIALIKNGNVYGSHAVFTPPVDMPNIEDGLWHPVAISWDAAEQQLSLTFDGVEIMNAYIPPYLNPFSSPLVYWGFTASTGAAFNEYMVKVMNYCVTTECDQLVSGPTGEPIQIFCNTATIAELEAEGTNISWYDADAAGNLLPGTAVLTDGASYYAQATSGECESDRLAVTVSLSSPAMPTAESPQEFCNSATIAQLTATGPGIQWYAGASGGTALASNTPLVDGGTYYATATSGECESIQRLAVTATITSVAIPYGQTAQNFCEGATVAALDATGTNVQWYLEAAGGNALPATTVLTDGLTYYSAATLGNCESAARFAVIASITVIATPTGSTSQAFCESATVAQLVAEGTNIHWYDTATDGNLLTDNNLLVNGMTYYAEASSGDCAIPPRMAVTATITTVAVPTGAALQSFCNSATVAELVAVAPNVQWFSTPAGDAVLNDQTALTDGSIYYAEAILGDCQSSSRFAVTVDITTISTPTGQAAQTFCNTATVADLAANGSGIQWFSEEIGGAPLPADTPLNNTTAYYAESGSASCQSTSRFQVMVTINTVDIPTGQQQQTFCNSATVAGLGATGSGIQWFLSNSGGSPLNASQVLLNGTTYYAEASVSGCQSPSRFGVTVTISTVDIPTGATVQTFCNSATVGELTATGNNLQWYATASGGNPLVATTPLVNNAAYYAAETIAGCTSAGRLAVTAQFNFTVANAIADKSQCIPANNTIYVLSSNDMEVLGSQAATTHSVSYYSTQENAQSSTSPITTIDINEGEYVFYARVSLLSDPNCFAITNFTLAVYRQPQVFVPQDYLLCDDSPYDGIELFDLASVLPQILGNANPAQFAVSYHSSQQDANNDVDALPQLYANSLANETIFVRVENTLSGSCYSTTSFGISTVPRPFIDTVTNMVTCDDDSNDHKEIFDLSTQNTAILGSQLPTQVALSYHLTQAQADSGSNAIDTTYENLANPQLIFVRVQNILHPECFATAPFELIVKPKPVIALDDTYIICDKEPITLSAGNGYTTYSWSTGADTPEITIAAEGIYSITVAQDYNGLICNATQLIEVIESGAAVVGNIEVDDWTDNDNSISLEITGEGTYEYSLDGTSYQATPVFRHLTAGVYTIYIRDIYGCGETTTEAVVMNYPKFFTPNRDGIHEYWRVENAQYEPQLLTYIFDRYGKLITSLDANSLGWDGGYNGRLMPSTDYWFVVIRQDGRQLKGHFSLVR